MYAPLRLLYAVRPSAPIILLAAVAGTSGMFAATPFVIPEVAARFGVTLGMAGLLATAQVGGFAVANLAAPRWLPVTGGLLRGSIAATIALNVVSVLVPEYWMLAAVRAGTGVFAGLITWIAWADAMHESRRMGAVAAVGPVAALVFSPVFGILGQTYDDRALYLMLAAMLVPALLLPGRVQPAARAARTVSRSRSNRVLLAALFLLTLAGSSLFVYAGSAGRRLIGMSGFAVSWGYSLNAAAGIIGTRFRSGRVGAGFWLANAGLSAAVLVLVRHPVAYFVALAWWGFVFWVGVPEVMRLLAARSLRPEERAGDAQGLMAFGRAIGPFLGGVLVGDGAFVGLGLSAAGGLMVAAVLISGVEVYRRDLRLAAARLTLH